MRGSLVCMFLKQHNQCDDEDDEDDDVHLKQH